MPYFTGFLQEDFTSHTTDIGIDHRTCFGLYNTRGFPGGSVVMNLPAIAGDAGSIPGLGKSPGGVHGNPLQYFCLENPMDRGTWQAMVCRVTKSQTQLK